jgi:hypothetical protein
VFHGSVHFCTDDLSILGEVNIKCNKVLHLGMMGRVFTIFVWCSYPVFYWEVCLCISIPYYSEACLT